MTRTAALTLAFILGSLSSAHAATVELGDDVQINTYTTGAQLDPKIASDQRGNFVVVWTSSQGDGDNSGVFGQRYDSLGQPVGGEFQVNTWTTFIQDRTAVAMDPGGDFVVVWSSHGQDGDKFGVFGQRFSSSGSRAGAEFQVSTYTPDAQQDPDVAMTGGGDFVVVWESYNQSGSGSRIFGQRFGSNGSVVGNEFMVSAFTTAGKVDPRVAGRQDGEFVVTWWDYTGLDGSDAGVFARIFDRTGAPLGGDFQVASYTTYDQESPDVAMNENGDFLVVWQDEGLDGSGDSVQARLFDINGIPVGPQFQVNTYTTLEQHDAAVAAGPNGEFAVIWESSEGEGNGYGIFGRLADDQGGPAGAEFQVNSYTTSDQREPFVTVDSAGVFTAVWYSVNYFSNGATVLGRQLYTHSPALSGPAGPLDCSDPAILATRPTFTWDTDTYDVFKVFMGSSPGFEKGTRTTSGKKKITTGSWMPSKKKWKSACRKAVEQAMDPKNPVMYVSILGKDKDLSKKDPARKRFSPAVAFGVIP